MKNKIHQIIILTAKNFQLPEFCCKIPDFFDDSDLHRCRNSSESLLRQENGRKKRFATSRMELGTCLIDCLFQTSGVTVSRSTGQTLDTNRLLKILVSETPTEPDSTTVVTNAVMQCLTELNTGLMHARRNPTTFNCNTIPRSALVLFLS